MSSTERVSDEILEQHIKILINLLRELQQRRETEKEIIEILDKCVPAEYYAQELAVRIRKELQP